MYGLINSALHDMVVSRFGETQWNRIRANADVPEDVLMTMRHYCDEATTRRLIESAAECLETTFDDCLERLGRHWGEVIAARDFATLIDIAGSTTSSFLSDLNGLFDRFSSTSLDSIPLYVSLETMDAQHGIHRFSCYSEKKGLTPFFFGLLTGLARYFDDSIEIVSVTTDETAKGAHSVFDIELK